MAGGSFSLTNGGNTPHPITVLKGAAKPTNENAPTVLMTRWSGRKRNPTMILPTDDESRIRSTENSWQAEYRYKRNGEDAWQPKTYHGTLGQAVGASCQREIRNHPAQTLTEALEGVNQIAAKYENAIDSAIARAELRVERLGQFS